MYKKGFKLWRGNELLKAGSELNNGNFVLLSTIRASLERIELEGIYLVDTGSYIYIYVLR